MDNPPEYRAMVKCYIAIKDGLATEPEAFADSLFQEELIPEGVKEKMTSAATTAKEKANELLSCVHGKVKNNPEFFENFLVILRSHNGQDSLIRKLEHKRGMFAGVVTIATLISTHTHTQYKSMCS